MSRDKKFFIYSFVFLRVVVIILFYFPLFMHCKNEGHLENYQRKAGTKKPNKHIIKLFSC